MSEQLNLGELLRDQGMALVSLFTADEWKARAYEAIETLARAGEPFTSEELREIVGDPPKPNAMGPIFHNSAMRGLIKRVGQRKAARPGMRATELPLWIGKAVKVPGISPVAPAEGPFS